MRNKFYNDKKKIMLYNSVNSNAMAENWDKTNIKVKTNNVIKSPHKKARNITFTTVAIFPTLSEGNMSNFVSILILDCFPEYNTYCY